jgi:hypothetical protein
MIDARRHHGGAPREGDRHAFRAGTPLDEADRAGTGASADDGAQSIGAIAGPITGPMGTLGPAPNDRARATRTTLAGGRTQQRSGRAASATAKLTRSE